MCVSRRIIHPNSPGACHSFLTFLSTAEKPKSVELSVLQQSLGLGVQRDVAAVSSSTAGPVPQLANPDTAGWLFNTNSKRTCCSSYKCPVPSKGRPSKRTLGLALRSSRRWSVPSWFSKRIALLTNLNETLKRFMWEMMILQQKWTRWNIWIRMWTFPNLSVLLAT